MHASLPEELKNPSGLRIIKTARTEESINLAARNGYWPLVKRVVRFPKIKSKFSVLQDSYSGEISVINDFRSGKIKADGDQWTAAIGFTFYYPHHFESPYAAYLIPADLEEDERVWIEDVIEDIVAGKWNQGDTYRLPSCEAIWNGSDLLLQFEEAEVQISCH